MRFSSGRVDVSIWYPTLLQAKTGSNPLEIVIALRLQISPGRDELSMCGVEIPTQEDNDSKFND